VYSTTKVSCLPFSLTDSISFRRCQSLQCLYVNAIFLLGISDPFTWCLASWDIILYVPFLAAAQVIDFRRANIPHNNDMILQRYIQRNFCWFAKSISEWYVKLVISIYMWRESLNKLCRLTIWHVSKLQNSDALGFCSSQLCI